jgi:hypothetical protein
MSLLQATSRRRLLSGSLLAENQREPVFAAANYDDLAIGRFRQLLRRLDSSPFQ